MVSKASEDLPEPERPVMTVRLSRGITTLMSFRLCWRAPRTVMRSIAIAWNHPRALQWRIPSGAETTIVNDSSGVGKRPAGIAERAARTGVKAEAGPQTQKGETQKMPSHFPRTLALFLLAFCLLPAAARAQAKKEAERPK